jgi:hypothetical protein
MDETLREFGGEGRGGEEKGGEGQRSTLPPSDLLAISPTRGETGLHLGLRKNSTIGESRIEG